MHRIVNRAIFLVLLLGGGCLAIALFALSPTGASRSSVLAAGVLLGWLGILLASIAFLFASALFAYKPFSAYWQSLCPLNFGLALLGFCFIRYVTSMAVATAIASAVGVVATIVLFRFGATRWRFLPIGVAAAVLVASAAPIDYVLHVAAAIVFIGLPLLVRVRGNNSGSSTGTGVRHSTVPASK